MDGVRYLVLGVTEVRSAAAPCAAGRPAGARPAHRTGRAGGPRRAPGSADRRGVAAGPATDATGALQALIARLRRALGRDAVTSGPGGYRLAAAPGTVDLFAFESLLREGEDALAQDHPERAAGPLARALALWRGPALADLPDREAAAARPEALRLTALRLKFDADLALGQAAAALPGAAGGGGGAPAGRAVPRAVDPGAARGGQERATH